MPPASQGPKAVRAIKSPLFWPLLHEGTIAHNGREIRHFCSLSFSIIVGRTYQWMRRMDKELRLKNTRVKTHSTKEAQPPTPRKTHTELGDVFPSDKKDLIIVRGVNLGKYWGGPPRNTTQPFSVSFVCVARKPEHARRRVKTARRLSA